MTMTMAMELAVHSSHYCFLRKKPSSSFSLSSLPISISYSSQGRRINSSSSRISGATTVRAEAAAEGEEAAVKGSNEVTPVPVSPSPNKPPIERGVGFGSSSSSSSSSSSRKVKKKGKRERATVIRRSPIDKPSLFSQQDSQQPQQQQSPNENAFLLTWLGLGFLILVEGIVLSASGFLPEEWDKLFVKYLYPSFTPTVFLFVGGTVSYGVFKYLQGERTRS